ncbi:glycosyltransferase family 2 protein [Rhizorhapis sp. SPR117]|uniref:glycosyltransferase family 2 protein n=1 Tax=Rhizorhapis sp. SPR117 TaxID=2912611 RepID=UPI001F2F4B7F|nr:glycosyltransferase family 2 protein [Rhizorhapis sp. SPR117]
MTSTRISVIIPHYNDLERLDRCLCALEEQSIGRTAYEIIVADNGSPQGEVALSAIIGDRARLVIVPEKGAGPARNGGVAQARGDILAFTDCDCLPHPQWLADGVAALDSHDVVGGKMTVCISHDGPMTGAEAFETVFAFDNENYVRTKGFTVTANLFCRRADFETIGPFRTLLSEDKDWCHRAIAKGYSLGYAAMAEVAHPARHDWQELKGKFRRINQESYSYIVLTEKYGRLLWLVRSFALPLSILPHGLKIVTTSKLRRPAERLSALAMLIRQRLWRFADAWRLLLTDVKG